MKTSLVLASVLISGMATSAFSTPKEAKVKFDGSCRAADFSASGTDIEYFNLNLDLDNSGSKECVITTTLPAKPGLRINVSSFKAEAFAEVPHHGLATLTVNHRFNGQQELVSRAIGRESGGLVAQQTAIGISSCGQAVELRTKLATKSVNSIVLQDSAQSNTVSYRVAYVPCH